MKLTIGLCSLILLVTAGYYYREYTKKTELKQEMILAGTTWPVGTYYEVDEAGDIILELEQERKIANGVWPEGTKFYFDGNKLKEIKVEDPFEFAQLKFNYPTKLMVESFPPHILHKLSVVKKIKIDGLDLHDKCNLEFKNYILYAANCPEFGTVYFKRFVKLPEIIPSP